MRETIGFIGIGNMGSAMASRLLSQGFSVVAYNRTAEKAKPLAELGAKLVDSPAEAVQRGGIVITMLADDNALKEVTLHQGVMEKLGENGIHISMSTVSPFTSRELAEKHARVGAHFVSAPVFGRPEHAREGKLWVCLSGNATAKKRVMPALEAMSQGVYDFGEDVGCANIVKLAGNFMICAVKEQLAEVLALGYKFGIDPKLLADFYTSTLFDAPIYKRYAELIIGGVYEPAGFRLALGLKDINLLADASAKANTPMPFASVVRDRLLSAMAKGRGELDWSALALGAFEDAGIGKGLPKFA